MGQSLRTHGSQEEKKAKVIKEAAERYYDDHIIMDYKSLALADFYRAVSETVEDLNKSLGYTQFQVPDRRTLEEAFRAYHPNEEKPLTKEEFLRILKDIILGTRITGVGAKDILLYIFGVPMATLFVKKRVMPQAMPDGVFISGVTSATVLALAKLNKI